ncbi:MAG: alpha/beta hydrolase [Bacteroidetes bacterium]|nr:alpha/beta hydrolase [Bacteroidota bacterium]
MSFLKTTLFATLIVATGAASIHAQRADSILYKQVDSTDLYLYIDYPPGFDAALSYPAIVFYFGGGWNGGTPGHFEHHARYFAQRGLVCFRADYRVKKKHGTSPFESLKDAKSAIRFVRENAGDLGVDPRRLIASGGSAGGHLAAATALVDGYNEDTDDLSFSCIPNALVLFNPVMDNGPGGYGYERVGEAYREFSPLHNIRVGAPPSIIFLGTEDSLIPVETARYYKTVMEKVGSRCDLLLYEGESHGFFNYGRSENYKLTVSEANRFLVSLGYLDEEPQVEIK